jgi:hypothetical protein
MSHIDDILNAPLRRTHPSSDLRIPLYSVIDTAELAHLQSTGNYGSSPSYSGKYFALTLVGARAFAGHSMNAGSMVTETTLPLSIVNQGRNFVDLGQHGAGSSVWFDETQLPMIYGDMTQPVIV